ncbi:MAG TPA: metal-dependent hydrolase [Firmicutes bacterium]|jgi:L-ascorbate metabolism protein UlaG (beta-lactamase superfamily)|nr:metal-dependent hydrolase [Bacillota bacterium]HAA37368.1 metal-dependent hydrolase [Bacillota bacterium]
MPTIRYLGHACFLVQGQEHTLLFDPYLTDNPQAAVTADQVKPDYILVSHGHYDHLGDTYAIAERTGATIITTMDLAKECEKRGLQAHAMNVGCKHHFPFGHVRTTQALHHAGLVGGEACGFIVRIDGFTLYFAGDTSLFGDFKLYGIIERPDLLLVPIGGYYTMDIDDAVYAAKLVGAKTVIPFHYNTWPIIEADPADFAEKISKNTSGHCIILQPGDSCELP